MANKEKRFLPRSQPKLMQAMATKADAGDGEHIKCHDHVKYHEHDEGHEHDRCHDHIKCHEHDKGHEHD